MMQHEQDLVCVQLHRLAVCRRGWVVVVTHIEYSLFSLPIISDLLMPKLTIPSGVM